MVQGKNLKKRSPQKLSFPWFLTPILTDSSIDHHACNCVWVWVLGNVNRCSVINISTEEEDLRITKLE